MMRLRWPLSHRDVAAAAPRPDPVQASHDESKVLPHLSRYESRNRRIYNQSLDRLGYEPTKKQKTQNEPSSKNEQ